MENNQVSQENNEHQHLANVIIQKVELEKQFIALKCQHDIFRNIVLVKNNDIQLLKEYDTKIGNIIDQEYAKIFNKNENENEFSVTPFILGLATFGLAGYGFYKLFF